VEVYAKGVADILWTEALRLKHENSAGRFMLLENNNVPSMNTKMTTLTLVQVPRLEKARSNGTYSVSTKKRPPKCGVVIKILGKHR